VKAHRDHLATRLRPGQLVDNLFRVSGIAEQAPRHKRAHFLLLAPTEGPGQFDAIVGRQATRLALGQTIRVRGCVLVRSGRPILVVCSLDSCARREP